MVPGRRGQGLGQVQGHLAHRNVRPALHAVAHHPVAEARVQGLGRGDEQGRRGGLGQSGQGVVGFARLLPAQDEPPHCWFHCSIHCAKSVAESMSPRSPNTSNVMVVVGRERSIIPRRRFRPRPSRAVNAACREPLPGA